MERQRYEVTLRCGGSDSVMWTNRLEELEPVLRLAITGSQSHWRMACAVRDTVTGAHAECSSETSIGFWATTQAMLEGIRAAHPRPLREGEGRDVVLEVQMAAHGATLEECRTFVCDTVEAALMSFTHNAQSSGPQFSLNGPTVGHAWFA